MKSHLLSLLLLAGSQFVFAQVDERKSFVYLYSDSVVYGNVVELKKPLFGASHLRVDSLKIPADQVKFFQAEKGFFANTKEFSFTGTSQFSERISAGKLNLYEKETRSVSYSAGMYGGMGTSTVTIKNYYNMGYGPLKKATYTNLSADLQSNAESMLHLDKFKSTTRTQTVLYGVGGGALLGGIIALVSNMQSESPSPSGTPQGDVRKNSKAIAPAVAMLGVGAGCFWASYFVSLSKPKHLKRAVDAYNY